ncbi:hypothetical protein GC197_17990 [bacterium]|nr:hypothetical protein [bacterium]
MEPNTEESFDDFKSENETAPRVVQVNQWQIVKVPVCILLLVGQLTTILWLLFSMPSGPMEYSIFFRLGLVGAAGFYFACGRLPWPLRLLSVALTVIMCVLSLRGPDSFEGIVVMGTVALIVTGLSYVIRMILAAILGESSPRQRFTIFGLMLVTSIVALCVFAFQWAAPSSADPKSLLGMLLMFTLFGLAFSAQGITLWANRLSELFVFAALALGLAFATPFFLYGVVISLSPNPPPGGIGAFLWLTWFMMITFWLVLYPLWFALRGLGIELIDPGWKLGATQPSSPSRPGKEEDVDVLMQD